MSNVDSGGAGHGNCPGDVRADVIPLNRVAKGRFIQQPNAAKVVTRDDVAGRRGITADKVVRSLVNLNTVLQVAQVLGPGDIGSDEVALNDIPFG